VFAVVIAAIPDLSLIYICGRDTARYAVQRGRSQIAWFIWGCLFFPLPRVVLALLPPHRKGVEGQ
jgi:ABC-type uncharacterized transport system YnjBCD permease subunit